MNRGNCPTQPNRRGLAMTYWLICFPLFIAFTGFAIDLGRLQLAKAEAQTVADSAARYAVHGMLTSSTPDVTAYANASAVVAQSSIDGSAPTVTQSDVVCGSYDATAKKFYPGVTGTAVKVTIHQSINRSGAAPMFIRILLPNLSPQITATAVANADTVTVDISPPASGNLWLSGMPNNTTTQNFRPDNSTVWDNSGTSGTAKQRPLEVALGGTGMTAGSTMTFEGLTGTASWQNYQSGTNNTADGDPTYIVANGAAPATSMPTNSNNGMSNVRAPIGAVMAVFMDDNAPTTTAAPANLDFNTATQRDYTSISPKLKQVFFVGDGKRSNGETQSIVIPQGATRVFFGMMDAWQWNDNQGTFKTRLYSQSSQWLVQ